MSYATQGEHRGQGFILNDIDPTRKKMCDGRLKRMNTSSNSTSCNVRSRVRSAYFIDNVNNHNKIQIGGSTSPDRKYTVHKSQYRLSMMEDYKGKLSKFQASHLKFDCNNLRLEVNQIKEKLMDLSRPFIEQSMLHKDQVNIYENHCKVLQRNYKENMSLESALNMYGCSDYESTMSSIATNLSTSTYESSEPMSIQDIVEELRKTGESLKRVTKERDDLRADVERISKQLQKADENCCKETQCLREESNGVEETMKNLIKKAKDSEIIRNEQNSMILQLESLKAKHEHCLFEIEELSDKVKYMNATTSIVSTSNEYLSNVSSLYELLEEENRNLRSCIEQQSQFLEKSESERESYELQYEKMSKTIKGKQRSSNEDSRIVNSREKRSTACQCVISKGQNEFMDRGTDMQKNPTTSQVTKSTQKFIRKMDRSQQADDFSLLNLILHKMSPKYKREIERAKTIEGKISALINIVKPTEENPFDDIEYVLQETNSAIESIINKIKYENKQYLVNEIGEPLQLIK